jgi:DNA-binding NarL/FixJ family response regulator
MTAALPARPTIPGVTEDAGLRRLSLRETRIARLVAEGLSDEQVATSLGIEVVEVRAELAEVFRKLGLRSRTELALLVPDRSDAEGGEDR